MSDLIFQGDVKIALQGDAVLNFLGHSEDQVQFEVIGFNQSKINISDFRPGIWHGVNDYFETGSNKQFIRSFNSIATIKMIQSDEDHYQIDIFDSKNSETPVYLWIVNGMDLTVPVYDYIFYLSEENQTKDKHAFVSIFH